MLLEGSCHCGTVRFAVESHAPYPYMYCYCSICRKTAGGGGFAINLHADAGTLKVEGREQVGVYRAFMDHPTRAKRSPGERHFCRVCASALWVWDPRWPELLHPFASCIDTPLPKPPERCHIMLDGAPSWVPVPPADAANMHFPQYPQEALVDWHRRHGLITD